MTDALSHKDRTAHVRKVLKLYGPKARVSLCNSCGSQWISISVPSYDVRWTERELEQIAIVAQTNHLTFARGQQVDVATVRQLTGKEQFDFVYHK